MAFLGFCGSLGTLDLSIFAEFVNKNCNKASIRGAMVCVYRRIIGGVRRYKLVRVLVWKWEILTEYEQREEISAADSVGHAAQFWIYCTLEEEVILMSSILRQMIHNSRGSSTVFIIVELDEFNTLKM